MLTFLLGAVVGLFVEDRFKVWDKAVAQVKKWLNQSGEE